MYLSGAGKRKEYSKTTHLLFMDIKKVYNSEGREELYDNLPNLTHLMRHSTVGIATVFVLDVGRTEILICGKNIKYY